MGSMIMETCIALTGPTRSLMNVRNLAALLRSRLQRWLSSRPSGGKIHQIFTEHESCPQIYDIIILSRNCALNFQQGHER